MDWPPFHFPDSGRTADVVRVGVCQENPFDFLRSLPGFLHVGKNGLLASVHAGINQIARRLPQSISIRKPPDFRCHPEINPELVQSFTKFHHNPFLSR